MFNAHFQAGIAAKLEENKVLEQVTPVGGDVSGAGADQTGIYGVDLSGVDHAGTLGTRVDTDREEEIGVCKEIQKLVQRVWQCA